jgi:hypothetical protein
MAELGVPLSRRASSSGFSGPLGRGKLFHRKFLEFQKLLLSFAALPNSANFPAKSTLGFSWFSESGQFSAIQLSFIRIYVRNGLDGYASSHSEPSDVPGLPSDPRQHQAKMTRLFISKGCSVHRLFQRS